MKKILGLISVALCSATVALFTSCLNSDGDGGIDPAEYQKYMTLMSGSYSSNGNKAYFYNDTISGDKKTDSLEFVSSYVYTADSTIVINGISNRVLAKTVKDSELKAAMENAPNGYIKAKFMFYNINGSQAGFFVYPFNYTLPTLNYGGKDHKVEVRFYGPTAGIFNMQQSEKMIGMSIIPSGVFVDDKKAESIYDGLVETEKIGKSEIAVYTWK